MNQLDFDKITKIFSESFTQTLNTVGVFPLDHYNAENCTSPNEFSRPIDPLIQEEFVDMAKQQLIRAQKYIIDDEIFAAANRFRNLLKIFLKLKNNKQPFSIEMSYLYQLNLMSWACLVILFPDVMVAPFDHPYIQLKYILKEANPLPILEKNSRILINDLERMEPQLKTVFKNL